MNRMSLLIRTQLFNYFLGSNSKKKGKVGGMFMTLILMGVMSFYYGFLFRDSLQDKSLLPYFMLYMIGGFLVLFAISTSQGLLFGFKDGDLLRSMPFTDREIVTSKLVVYLVVQYAYAICFFAPGVIFFGVREGNGLVFVLNTILTCLTFPLVPTVVAASLGALVQKLSAGKKHGEMIRNMLNVVMVLAIMFVSMNTSARSSAGSLDTQVLKMGGLLVHLRWYGNAIVQGNFLDLLKASAVSLAFAYGFVRILSTHILKINVDLSRGYHVENFRLKKTGVKSKFRTLLAREAACYFSNFGYVFNTLFGMFIMVGVSVYAVIQKQKVLAFLAMVDAGFTHELGLMLASGVAFFGLMSCCTSSSISLEGKALWIIRTLPIKTREIFLAKALLNVLIIIIPSFISLSLMDFAFNVSIIGWLTGISFIFVTAIAISVFGLLVNLRFPKLDYVSEVAVIKQSMAAMIGVLVPMFVGMAEIIVILSKPYTVYYFLLATAVLDIVMIAVLNTKGVQKFESLN